jgi:hypothetical protein
LPEGLADPFVIRVQRVPEDPHFRGGRFRVYEAIDEYVRQRDG